MPRPAKTDAIAEVEPEVESEVVEAVEPEVELTPVPAPADENVPVRSPIIGAQVAHANGGPIDADVVDFGDGQVFDLDENGVITGPAK